MKQALPYVRCIGEVSAKDVHPSPSLPCLSFDRFISLIFVSLEWSLSSNLSQLTSLYWPLWNDLSQLASLEWSLSNDRFLMSSIY